MAPTTRRGNAIAIVATILLLTVAMASAAAEVSCGDAVSALIPCGSFLVGADAGAAGPSESCCRGAQALRRMAGTAGARRALCRCLEESGPSFGVLPDRARQLPARCKLGVSIPVSPHTDCGKIP
ncbi:non-specific lipid-transfer protein A [Lolium perenne]|uniref:non-specific lipid-transfer protein A n=2 Tax=Lolium TaxID=4520 RepID=UPI0021EA10C4|nr:non-specific lipid-transfer protein A-like [Lolium perenne]